ncbi:CaiB/BaiF CoA transferase family protein [Desulfovirgula thermocuniculi]|uniref:CaiB/BaiF CoA transferase family protein n=1 Tax=Desulfovirgula thermocuniculi TaxID=348842 RepID=UPI00041087D5|nr:CaiB/BaiF CoA-transferase family protein [Desulfovirgula thermocuniculi]
MYRLLENMKVLDLTRLLPGGYATMLLADLGAQVLKVEDTVAGDYMRDLGPRLGEMSVWYHAINRNKKSVRLNLKSPDGREIFLRLVREYDVLVESFRPGVMERLGLGYRELAEINPRLVYCSLTGFGQSGPHSQRPCHDINCLALAGALALTGQRDGPPIPPGVQVADLGGALTAAVGILAAYVRSAATGQGAYLDVAMLDVAVSWMTLYLTQYLAGAGEPRRGEEFLNGGLPCYGVYRTGDGRFVAVGNLEPKFWENFCRAAGRPDLIPLQFARDGEARRRVEEFFARLTRAEIEELFGRADTCLEPVLEVGEVPQHPQVKARNILIEQPAEGGTIITVGLPLKIQGAGVLPVREAPAPGQHTREVLLSLGYSEEEVGQFLATGVAG